MIHRSQPRKLNKDTDERLLRFDEMKQAVNVLVKASQDGDEGVVKMAEGNEVISFVQGEALAAGTNTVIGSVTDEDALVVYFFVHNDQGNHSVCGYSSRLNKCFVIYQNSSLSFKENGFVKADIVKNRRVSEVGSLNVDTIYNDPIVFEEDGGFDDGEETITLFAKEVEYKFVFDITFDLTLRGNTIGRDYYGSTSDVFQNLIDQGAFVGQINFDTSSSNQFMYDGVQDVNNETVQGSLSRIVEDYSYQVIGGKDCLVMSGSIFVNPEKLDDPGAKITCGAFYDANPETGTGTEIIGSNTIFGDLASSEITTRSIFFGEPGSNISTNPVIVDSLQNNGGPYRISYTEEEPQISDFANAYDGELDDIFSFLSRIKVLNFDGATGFTSLAHSSAGAFSDAFLGGAMSINFEDSPWHQTGVNATDNSFEALQNDFEGIYGTTSGPSGL